MTDLLASSYHMQHMKRENNLYPDIYNRYSTCSVIIKQIRNCRQLIADEIFYYKVCIKWTFRTRFVNTEVNLHVACGMKKPISQS